MTECRPCFCLRFRPLFFTPKFLEQISSRSSLGNESQSKPKKGFSTPATRERSDRWSRFFESLPALSCRQGNVRECQGAKLDRKQQQYQKKKIEHSNFTKKDNISSKKTMFAYKEKPNFWSMFYLYIVACNGPRVSTEIDTLPLLHELWTTTTPCWPWASYEMNDALLRIDLWMNWQHMVRN